MTDWKTRHDIDQIKWVADELQRLFQSHGVSNFRELLGNYYDQSVIDEKASKLDKDLNKLNDDLDTFESDLSEFSDKLDTLDGDTSDLSSDLTALSNSLDSVVSDVSTLQTDLSGLSSDLSGLDGDLTTLTTTVGGLQTDLGGLDSDLTTLTGTVSGITTTIGDNNGGLIKQLNNLSSSISGLDGDLSGLVTDLDVLSAYMTDFEGDLNDLVAELQEDEVTFNVLDIQSDMLKLFASIGSVKADVSTVESEIGDTSTSGTIKYNINQVKTTVGDNSGGLVKDLNDAQSDISSIQGDISTVQSDISTVQSDISTAQSDISTAQSDISTAQTDISNLESTIGESSDSYSDGDNTLYGILNDTSSDVSTVQGDITTIQGDITTVQGDITTVQGDITDVQGDISGIQTDVGEVDVEVNDDLQTQILNIISMMADMFIPVAKVDSILDVTESTLPVEIGGITTTYYIVPEDYQYDIVHTSDDEFFKKKNVMINNVEYVVWDWVENPFVSQFQQTTLYGILSSLFVERTTRPDSLATFTVGTGDYDRTNFTTCDITFYKQLNIVTCIYDIATVSFNNTVDHTILDSGKLPSDFRPLTTFYQDVGSYVGDVRHGLLSILPNGTMYIRMGTENTSMHIQGRLTYVVED